MKVYVTGSLERAWRDRWVERLRVEGFDLVEVEIKGCGNMPEDPKPVVDLDKKAIEEADVLLADFSSGSPRVAMELMYAWLNGKTTVVVSGGRRLFPWIRRHAHIQVDSLDEAIEQLKKQRQR